MKKILLIILTFSLTEIIYCQEPLQEFKEILGEEQSSAFDQAVESYKKFLELNYSDQDSLGDQNAQFLRDLQNINTSGLPDWNLPDDIQAVLNQWEETGLRSEIRLWPNERYIPKHLLDLENSTSEDEIEFEIIEEIIPIRERDGQTASEPTELDSSFSWNDIGKYIYALDQCCLQDSIINEYIEVKRSAGDLSIYLIAGGLVDTFHQRLSDPILIRIIVAELYFWLMMSELEK